MNVCGELNESKALYFRYLIENSDQGQFFSIIDEISGTDLCFKILPDIHLSLLPDVTADFVKRIVDIRKIVDILDGLCSGTNDRDLDSSTNMNACSSSLVEFQTMR